MMRVLITGICGFIGHHVASVLLHETDWDLVGVDRLDATSTLHRLRYIDRWEEHAQRVKFAWHDLRAPINGTVARQIGPADVILHLAASTHVDRSIDDPLAFVADNVVGTGHMLEFARSARPQLVVNFSTDEVFGPTPEGMLYQEWDRFHSNNPYAATKAGAVELGSSYHNTFGVPVLTTFCMNVLGERQHPEKFVPKALRAIMARETVEIHADATRTRSGSRFYTHASNIGHALRFLVDHALGTDRTLIGNRVNIAGERELTNLELAQELARRLDLPLSYEFVAAESVRPGHDFRYALDGSKLRAMGWSAPEPLDRSLDRIVAWYAQHPEWLERLPQDGAHAAVSA